MVSMFADRDQFNIFFSCPCGGSALCPARRLGLGGWSEGETFLPSQRNELRNVWTTARLTDSLPHFPLQRLRRGSTSSSLQRGAPTHTGRVTLNLRGVRIIYSGEEAPLSGNPFHQAVCIRRATSGLSLQQASGSSGTQQCWPPPTTRRLLSGQAPLRRPAGVLSAVTHFPSFSASPGLLVGMDFRVCSLLCPSFHTFPSWLWPQRSLPTPHCVGPVPH